MLDFQSGDTGSNPVGSTKTGVLTPLAYGSLWSKDYCLDGSLTIPVLYVPVI